MTDGIDIYGVLELYPFIKGKAYISPHFGYVNKQGKIIFKVQCRSITWAPGLDDDGQLKVVITLKQILWEKKRARRTRRTRASRK